MRKRMVVLADGHSGHRVGLTPPDWFQSTRYGEVQRALWWEYRRIVDTLKPIDILVYNGDAIDGKGERSGSSELITADRNEQIDMAEQCVDIWEPNHVYFTYGTAYHTGRKDDFEKHLADKIGAEIRGQHWLDVNGVVFDFKHKVGSTSIPHGKGTQISKERLWNLIWSEHEEQPKADIIIRSHIHNFFHCGEDHWLGITTPALQGQGSKFGSRQCSQHVDWGLVWFDIEEDGTYSWGRDIVRPEVQRQKVIKL